MKTVCFVNPPTYALEGDLRIIVTGGSDLDRFDRRVSRMKLLDNTVHITDMGYCEADRDITLFSDEMPEADFRLLRQWFADYETLFLALPAGFYTAAPYSLSVSDGTVAAVFMLKARVDT